jgi:hypothetical protein
MGLTAAIPEAAAATPAVPPLGLSSRPAASLVSPYEALLIERNQLADKLRDLLPAAGVKDRAIADKLRARINELDDQMIKKNAPQFMPGAMTPEIRQQHQNLPRTFNSLPFVPASTLSKSRPRILVEGEDKLGRKYWYDQATGNRVRTPD